MWVGVGIGSSWGLVEVLGEGKEKRKKDAFWRARVLLVNFNSDFQKRQKLKHSNTKLEIKFQFRVSRIQQELY